MKCPVCRNALTIADYPPICRQCRIERTDTEQRTLVKALAIIRSVKVSEAFDALG